MKLCNTKNFSEVHSVFIFNIRLVLFKFYLCFHLKLLQLCCGSICGYGLICLKPHLHHTAAKSVAVTCTASPHLHCTKIGGGYPHHTAGCGYPYPRSAGSTTQGSNEEFLVSLKDRVVDTVISVIHGVVLEGSVVGSKERHNGKKSILALYYPCHCNSALHYLGRLRL